MLGRGCGRDVSLKRPQVHVCRRVSNSRTPRHLRQGYGVPKGDALLPRSAVRVFGRLNSL